MVEPLSGSCQIGDWIFRCDLNQLQRNGESLRLEPRVGELLVFLLQSRDQAVSREQIMEAIWPGVVVGDEAITAAVNKLRRALGDDSQHPQYIETLPKIGYRLIAPVEHLPAVEQCPPGHVVTEDTPPSSDRVKLRLPAAIGVAAIALLVLLVAYLWQSAPESTTSADNSGDEAVNTGGVPSLLVLPFENIGGNPNDEIFADGIAADITTDLSRLSNLLVIANQSALSFKQRNISPLEAGRELDATYILDGNIRRSGENLRMNVQLIEAGSGYSLWADRYDRRLQNLFEIQDEITASIVKSLSIRLTSQEEAAIRSIAATDFRAYELFLRGLQKYNSHIQADSMSAIEDYRQAIEIDPGFARVYGALGVVYARNYRLGWTDSPKETLDRALEYARKAVEIDNSVPQVYWALGYVHLHRREFVEAEQAVEEAIRLAPNYADGFGLLALIQNSQGHWQDAIENIRRGMQLNPYYSYDYPYNLGRAYYLGGRYQEAIDSLAHALEKNEMAEMPRLYTIASYLRLGDEEEARWQAEQLSVLHPQLSLSGMQRSLPQDTQLLQELMADLEAAGVR